MTTILVTGGNGGLGREIVQRLLKTSHTTRIMSRSPRPASASAKLEWVQADMETGMGLDEAVKGVDVIVHSASSPMQRTFEVDVDGTKRLLEAARAADIKHIVYISIVGIDRIPYSYYRAKVDTEKVIEAGGVPYTILRATQFHTLIANFLKQTVRFPLIALAPTSLKFQPVETGEVADEMVRLALGEPAERVPDMGGPEVLNIGQMLKVWLAAKGQRRLIIPIPAVGAWLTTLRKGYNTCPEHRQGKITWAQWVQNAYGKGQ
jgi:uncharacterized protein YbjT (DUF2867 family)